MEQRLQRILAAAGVASRRAAEQWIRDGRVQLNGRVAQLGERADPERDDIRVDGERLHRERLRYWLLHKPKGVLTTVSDARATQDGRSTVMDLLPADALQERIYPVGRLDVDSEGLLLLTNDGEIAQALLHPSFGSEKEYRVTVRGMLGAATAEKLAAGILLEDGPMAPCRVTIQRVDEKANETVLMLVLQEGRKRQIRRALRSLGHPVLRLLRVRMGPLRLAGLRPRELRPLTGSEIEGLRRYARARRRHAKQRGKH